MTKENEIGWNFDNSYRHLPDMFFTDIYPNPVSTPELIILNEPLAISLGLSINSLKTEEGIAVLGGNVIPGGTKGLAQAYAGHQFGHFAMLGDGRAMLVGEQITPKGERVDIQLKGSGKTPYSRGGDGRAGIGPMLREYIISEAMHGLGVPTTRSLAVLSTGDRVIRETMLNGGIMTRVASSHLRFGTFEYASKWGTLEDLKELADYAIKRHFPEIESNKNRYLLFLKSVIEKQAKLVAKWQLVGFVHGVMNTDNMTTSGETIDYGPCAFMDTYDRGTVFSSIDIQGRYSYKNQPAITGWNLARFAETIIPLLHEEFEEGTKLAQEAISEFSKLYETNWLLGMRKKLGLLDEEKQDVSLIGDLLSMMEKHHADYTNTFRALTLNELVEEDLFKTEAFTQWYELWLERLRRQQDSEETIKQMMRASNPAVIPRNHLVEDALETAVEHKDYSLMKKLVDLLSNPYDYSTEQLAYKDVSELTVPYQTYCGT